MGKSNWIFKRELRTLIEYDSKKVEAKTVNTGDMISLERHWIIFFSETYKK